ncbi:protein PTCD3 homolog, mitochondrial isoform X1 [Hylaeus anthracinus]|uniref:protein PTCD3 homolog, mitochondrial isoform X1 n=1 Tax=Hylaeus anthracinus TaxID=313031 RepID=UPI0023B90AB9|nr:protein PTCD3 homolog, mitochondrial isoform X1 [Hylaeus anthracinus]
MNHFTRITHSRKLAKHCRLNRLESTMSSEPSIKIPPRIHRGPTDILRALDSTVPKDPLSASYKYHDDPFLYPIKKLDQRAYALSYESGKKTAMWIHKQHGNLFPTDLSQPQIKAFIAPTVYTDKSQVSEEILLQAISQCNVADALDIYNLLECDVSNKTKQALLELLCFYNANTDSAYNLPHERWFVKPNETTYWSHHPEIEKLYNFLITQDPLTAAKAHNTLICGYSKWKNENKAWLLFQKCLKEDIPLSVTTYNSGIPLITKLYIKDDQETIHLLNEIFQSMDAKGVYPNVGTLNAALKVASSLLSTDLSLDFGEHLLNEFKRMKIKFSLSTYYYIISINRRTGDHSYSTFMNTLNTMLKENFTLQDPLDCKFFTKAIETASRYYTDKKAGEMVHKLFLTGNNHKFLTSAAQEQLYFNTYLTLMLMTSTMEEFYKCFQKTVPHMYIPSMHHMVDIIAHLKTQPATVLAEYIPKFWSYINTFEIAESALSINMIELIKTVDVPSDSPLNAIFADVAWSCWIYIQKEMKKSSSASYETSITGWIAILLLRDSRVTEMREVLTNFVKDTSKFLPTMQKSEINQLFEGCISQKCFQEALLVLEYCINLELEYVVEIANKLCNNPELSDADRDKLVQLVGSDTLNLLNKK